MKRAGSADPNPYQNVKEPGNGAPPKRSPATLNILLDLLERHPANQYLCLQGKTQHWRGKLFVFDDRLVVPIRKPAHGEQKEEDVIRWDCGGGCCVSLQPKCTVHLMENLCLENSSSYIFVENILICFVHGCQPALYEAGIQKTGRLQNNLTSGNCWH